MAVLTSTSSYWTDTQSLPRFRKLDRDLTVDVAVIGAGIAGLSVAYEVAREGRSVLVLDQGEIGGGQTGRTTAHFSNAFDDRYFEIERMHGETAARLTAESHTAAIARTARIVTDEEIHCGLVHLDGWLFAALVHPTIPLLFQGGLHDGVPPDWAPWGHPLRVHALTQHFRC